MGRFELRTWFWRCGIGAALLVIGCSSGDPLRQAIEGTVTVNGELAGEGTLFFYPANGNHGPSASILVHKGRYRMDESRGPYAGDHGVRFMPHPDRSSDPESMGPKRSHAASRYETADADCVEDSDHSVSSDRYELEVEVQAGQLNLYFNSAP